MPVDNTRLKQHVRDFITQNRAAVLATVGADGIPHAATIYCAVDADLTLYFMTGADSRKYQNLVHQPTVAMVFTDRDSLEAVQLTGTAERVADLLSQETLDDIKRMDVPVANQRPVPALQLFESGATNELATIRVTPIEMTHVKFNDKLTKRKRKPIFEKVI